MNWDDIWWMISIGMMSVLYIYLLKSNDTLKAKNKTLTHQLFMRYSETIELKKCINKCLSVMTMEQLTKLNMK